MVLGVTNPDYPGRNGLFLQMEVKKDISGVQEIFQGVFRW